jgi:hypothetical protein
MTWLRGTLIEDPEELAALGVHADDASSEASRGARRVVVSTDRSREGIAAAMRHELEHSHQLEEFGATLQQRHAVAKEVLAEHAGDAGQLAGAAALYNAIPMEADANAAAATFARNMFGDDRINALIHGEDPDAALFRPTQPPGPLDTLLDRMGQFIINDGPAAARNFADHYGGPV